MVARDLGGTVPAGITALETSHEDVTEGFED
jgi:hypothetical protein